jgi:hypothetical protein
MKNFLIILLCFPSILFSQDVLSDEKLIEIKNDLLQERIDLELWWDSESDTEDYLIIKLKEGVSVERWAKKNIPDSIIYDTYLQNIHFTSESEGGFIEGKLDLDNDMEVEDYWWDESEEDRLNDSYNRDSEDIERSIQAINTYLKFKNIKENEEDIPEILLDTLPWPSSYGLLVECDTFGMEEWIGNWISEGVEPGEYSVYENWYVVFKIVSELDIYLPLIIEFCDYDNINNVMTCGGDQEIKIGEEYRIQSVSTVLGERGNGIIFVYPDIAERY